MKSKELKKNTVRQMKAKETKKNLYMSAIKLFKEKGYYNVKVDDITKEAGTSKGSFYTYFKSKDQVMVELFRQYDDFYIEIYNNLSEYRDIKKKLYQFIIELYKYFNEKVGYDIIHVIYSTQLFYDKEKTFIMNEDRPLYKVINQIIEEGQENREFKTDKSSVELSKMVIRCIRGTFYDWCLNDGKCNLVEDGQKFFSVFIEGMCVK